MREGIQKMNALWKDMDNLKLTDKGMIWNSDLVETLELQNCMVNANQIIRGPRPERRVGGHTPGRTSRTAWMNWITPNLWRARSPSLWSSTGGSTPCPSLTETLEPLTSSTELSLTIL